MARLTTAARCLAIALLLLLLPPVISVAVAQVGTTVPVVVDATGQVMGTPVVGVGGFETVHVILDTPAGGIALKVVKNPDRVEAWGPHVYFAAPNCAGTPYIGAGQIGPLTRTESSRVSRRANSLRGLAGC